MSDHKLKTLKELASEQIAVGCMDENRLHAMKELILEDGTIDDEEVTILRTMIFGTKTLNNRQVRRCAVEFLFELNESTIEVRNGEKWKQLFIDAVSSHVLNDKASTDRIDEEEAVWLINLIERDEQYDPNEIALLQHLQETVQEIPMSVRFRLGIILSLI